MSWKKLTNSQLAWRAAQDIEDGAYVNLGIGLPELIASFHPEGRHITYHTENGVLGFGEAPLPCEEDWDLIKAGKKPITIEPGASFFHHADSFAMVRGGHLDLAVLGAYQVAQNGDLANWRVGNRGVPAVGGAMDLVHGAKRVAVVTDHTTKDGKPKLVERCARSPVLAASRGFMRHGGNNIRPAALFCVKADCPGSGAHRCAAHH